MNKNCDDKGKIKLDSMTRYEKRGFHKMIKRKRAGPQTS